MDRLEILQRMEELEREIAALPPGSLTAKKVNGKEYYYHRYTVNGKRSENYIDFNSVEELRSQIEKRKALEAELKALKKSIPVPKATRKKKDTHEFKTYVRIGDQLRNWAAPVKKYKGHLRKQKSAVQIKTNSYPIRIPYPISTSEEKMVVSVLPLSCDNKPGTFSKSRNGGRFSAMIRAISKKTVPLVSWNPSLRPATEKL